MRLIHLAVTALFSTLLFACDGGVSDSSRGGASVVGQPSYELVLESRGAAPAARTKLGALPVVLQLPGDPAPPVEPVDTSCDGTEARAQAIAAAAVAAGKGCQIDADCTVSTAQTSCWMLGGRTAIGFAGLAHFNAEVAAIPAVCATATTPVTENPDGSFSSVGCPLAIMDYFGPSTAVCNAGTCELGAGNVECLEGPDRGDFFTTDAQTVEGCLDCGLASQKAATALSAALVEFVGCDADTDCVVASDNNGHTEGCGVAINAAYGDAWDATLDGIVASYGMGGCPMAVADCLPRRAACVEHGCRMVATDDVASW